MPLLFYAKAPMKMPQYPDRFRILWHTLYIGKSADSLCDQLTNLLQMLGKEEMPSGKAEIFAFMLRVPIPSGKIYVPEDLILRAVQHGNITAKGRFLGSQRKFIRHTHIRAENTVQHTSQLRIRIRHSGAEASLGEKLHQLLVRKMVSIQHTGAVTGGASAGHEGMPGAGKTGARV